MRRNVSLSDNKITKHKLDFEERCLQLEREETARRFKIIKEDWKAAKKGHLIARQPNLKMIEVMNKFLETLG